MGKYKNKNKLAKQKILDALDLEANIAIEEARAVTREYAITAATKYYQTTNPSNSSKTKAYSVVYAASLKIVHKWYFDKFQATTNKDTTTLQHPRDATLRTICTTIAASVASTAIDVVFNRWKQQLLHRPYPYDIHNQNYDNDTFVGKGKEEWKKWTTEFDSPSLALFDLVDTAITASWTCRDHKPKLRIDSDTIGRQQGGDEVGLVISHGSQSVDPIGTMLRLVPYKDHNLLCTIRHTAIVSLSDLSFLFYKCNHRNHLNKDVKYLGIAILSKELQRDNEFVFPYREWEFDELWKEVIADDLVSICNVKMHTWGKAFARYGCVGGSSKIMIPQADDLKSGIMKCMEYFAMLLFHDDWKDCDNACSTVLTDLKENCDANILFTEVKAKIPREYLHLSSLHITVKGIPIEALYWERRLVELTKFEIQLSTTELWCDVNQQCYSLPSDNPRSVFHVSNPNKILRLFCGFDPHQASINMNKVHGPLVLLYSRQWGRYNDRLELRTGLGLSNGSATDFYEGMTILIDDRSNSLPYNTQKERCPILNTNLTEWLTAIARFYWTYHYKRFGNSTSSLREALLKSEPALKEAYRNYVSKMIGRQLSPEKVLTTPLYCGSFITFNHLKFSLKNNANRILQICSSEATPDNCVPDIKFREVVRLNEGAVILAEKTRLKSTNGRELSYKVSEFNLLNNETLEKLITNETDGTCMHRQEKGRYHLTANLILRIRLQLVEDVEIENKIILKHDRNIISKFFSLIFELEEGMDFQLHMEMINNSDELSSFLFSTVTNLILMKTTLSTDEIEFAQDFLSLAIRCKYYAADDRPLLRRCGEYWPTLSNQFDSPSFTKQARYQRATHTMRGIINICYRETKSVCQCTKQKYFEAMVMPKESKCCGCFKILPRKQLEYCSGCMEHEYCSKECQTADWVGKHKHFCKRINFNRCGACALILPKQQTSSNSCIHCNNV